MVLFHDNRLLLLKRAAWKKFAPNRWTGVGGKVEPHELGDLEAAARRELFEETDLDPDEVLDLRLRRTLTFDHPAEGLVCLLYFSGAARSDRTPACNEGSLHWVEPNDLDRLDLIENTGRVLPLLIDDWRRGGQQIYCGVARYDRHGRIEDLVFATGDNAAP